MQMKQKQTEAWEALLYSTNIFDDLRDIYDDAFFIDFANRFDRTVCNKILARGVIATAHAYLLGKWRKRVQRAKWRAYSGPNLAPADFVSKCTRFERLSK